MQVQSVERRLIAPRRPRRGGRVYTPDDVMRCGWGGLDLGMGLDSSEQRPWGSDLRDLFSPGQLLAYWQLWNPSTVAYLDGPGEQVVDGAFNSGANWNDSGGGGWTVMGGFGVGTLALNGNYLDAAVPPLTVGATYLTTYTVPQCINGSTRIVLGTATGTYRTAGGPYTERITCAGSGALRFEGIAAGFSGTIDNASVIELPGIHTVQNVLNPGTYDLTQTTPANQPWLHPTAWGAGYPCAEYNGTSHYNTANAIAANVTGDDLPLAVVTTMEWVTHAANARMFSFGNSADATMYHDAMSDGTNVDINRRSGGAVSASGATAASGALVFAHLFYGTTCDTYINGAVDINGQALNTTPLSVDRFAVGALIRTVISNYSNIHVRDMAVIKSATPAQGVAASRLLAARNYI